MFYLADIVDECLGQRRISWSIGDEQAVVVETLQVLIPRHQVDLWTPLQKRNQETDYSINNLSIKLYT